MALQLAPDLTKLVMHFRSGAQGWSEGHWLAPVSSTALAAAVKLIVDWRLALLPPSLSLVYAKTSRVGDKRDSIPVKYSYPAVGTFPGDVVVAPATEPNPGSINIEVSQIAVSMRVWTIEGAASTRWVHGVPDNRVTAEVLTDAINEATAVPPAPGTLTAAVDWPTRFGMYMYHIKRSTVYGARKRDSAGVLRSYSDVIDDMMVSGVVAKKTGAPFRQQAGRASVR